MNKMMVMPTRERLNGKNLYYQKTQTFNKA